LSEAKLQGAFLFDAKLQGANLSRANLQGAKLSGANMQGANISLSRIYGADFSGANIADILCFNPDTTIKDDTEWDRIIAECEGRYQQDYLKKVKADVIKSQTSPWERPAALVSNKNGFIAFNKIFAFESSFITQRFLEISASLDHSKTEKAIYSEIAAYIRANCPEDIRQEIKARERGHLLEDPA
ncbi:MAG: pentapeptide repeat-containing protein, partial [Nitrospinota bacterium]|nr:pentapeptide repeat-containing protein [Nitrospinota bacterium]